MERKPNERADTNSRSPARTVRRTTLLALLWSLPAEGSERELEQTVRARVAAGEVELIGALRGSRFWEDDA